MLTGLVVGLLLVAISTQAQDHDGAEAAVIAKLPELLPTAEPPLDAAQLLAGKVLLRFASIDADIQRVRAWVVINADRKLVWSVLIDCDQALHYVPNMQACEVRRSGIGDDGNAFDITYHRVKPYFFLPSVENLFRADYLPPDEIRFRKAGGDLVHFVGRWQFHHTDEQQTLLHYDAEVDLRAALNVRGERRMIRRDVSVMLRRLKQLAEQEQLLRTTRPLPE